MVELLVWGGQNGDAQTPSDLSTACVTTGGALSHCATIAVVTQSLMGDVGLLGGGGAEVPGTASNLGTRVGGGPRLSFSGRVGVVRFALPDLGDPTGMGETSFLVPSIEAGVTIGLFDGLRVMPTVGGLFAVDVFGGAGFLSLGEPEGFAASIRSYSAGLRVGILRESFTLPGVSLSVARRFHGTVDFGDTADGDAADVIVSPTVTSVRATVGKNLFAVEVMAGVGWDEYTGETTVRVSNGIGGVVGVSDALSGSRLLYFGGGSVIVNIVFSLSIEGGWAQGLGPVESYGGSHDPSGGTPFGSFSLRLTL